MSESRLTLLLVLSLGALGAWPLDASGCQGAETASASTASAEVLRAYIDPGAAGFVIVTVLGFISSVGYWARAHLARAKRRLFGPRDAAADADADDEAGADGNAHGEGGNC